MGKFIQSKDRGVFDLPPAPERRIRENHVNQTHHVLEIVSQCICAKHFFTASPFKRKSDHCSLCDIGVELDTPYSSSYVCALVPTGV